MAPRFSLALGFAAALLASSAPAEEPRARPNILFIATDDLRAELGCYGDEHVISPNIDRLAARGVLFQRAYCAQPTCGPSRTSILTGLRPDTSGVFAHPVHFREKHPDIVTLPQFFKNNGYTSHGIGKVFHNAHQPEWRGDDASWSRPPQMHYLGHGGDKPVVEGEVPPNHSDVPRTEMRDVPDDAYYEGQVANFAIEALRDLKDDPFFLAVGFWKPHLPFNAPKKYWDMYDRDALPRISHPDFPQDTPQIAYHGGNELMRSFDEDLTPEQIAVLRHGYFAAITYMDAQIGRVLDELEDFGLADNTIIVLWSDHGYHLGEQDMWCKLSLFELDARVPLIISTPGMRNAGQMAPAPVELLDVYPTLADLADLAPPDHLEGISLRPILEDTTVRVKPFAFTQTTSPHRNPQGNPPHAIGYSMRGERYRYTEWRVRETGEVAARELYDYTDSWIETENISERPENAALVASMARSLAATFPAGPWPVELRERSSVAAED